LAKDHTWSIYIIRAKAQYIGHVEAPDEKTAIEQAIKEFKLTAEQQKRLMARRELYQI
jgi:hypothetical protein